MTKHNNPEVRFAGYTEDWKEQELGEVLSERNVLQKISKDAPILAFASGQGVIDRSERKSNNRDHLTHDQENKVYKLTELNDIVYNPSNLKYGAIDRNKHGRGVISPIYVTFTTEEEPSFLELIVKSEKFKLRALRYEEGTVVKRQSVKPEDLLSLKVKISPNKDEQKNIGIFFKNIDNLISTSQLKYNKLKTLKKAMLVKMFPKNDANIPEIRFRGFTDNWSPKKLGEVGSTQSGIGYPAKEQGGINGFPFYKVSDMNNAGNEHEMNNSNNYVNNAQMIKLKWKPIKHVPSIIFAKVGGAIMLNRKRLVRTPFLIDNNMMAYLFDETWDENFGKALFETINLSLYAQTGALPSYNGSDIEAIQIKTPSNKAEQIKIGTYFKCLDNLTTFYMQELERLKSIRQACFEKMTSSLSQQTSKISDQ